VPAQLIDGKAVAQEVEAEVRSELAKLGYSPNLIVIRVGNDPASEVYVRNKARKAKELGLRGTELIFDASMTEADLLAHIDRLNGDDDVDGILVQLPLPPQIDSRKIIKSNDPRKDVDGFHPVNVGLLHLGQPSLVPCTPAGVMRLIASTGTKIEGSRSIAWSRPSDSAAAPRQVRRQACRTRILWRR